MGKNQHRRSVSFDPVIFWRLRILVARRTGSISAYLTELIEREADGDDPAMPAIATPSRAEAIRWNRMAAKAKTAPPISTADDGETCD